MIKHPIITLAVVLSALLAVACGGNKGGGKLVDATDSLSYVVGMNIAYNILKMDTTVRAEAVIAGLEDALRQREVMTMEDAKRYFLGYHNFDVYERVRAYEEQFLSDLAASDGDVVRTETGLTYKVLSLGDMGLMAGSDRDTVAFTYRATDIDGNEVDPAADRADTLRVAIRTLQEGLKEGVKLVGQGGSVTLWVPSSQAFGSAGDKEKGIEPNQMLRYDVNIVEVKRR